MTTTEINTFIETMGELGDVWTVEQVQDVYGNISLQDALNDRQASLSHFVNIITKALHS